MKTALFAALLLAPAASAQDNVRPIDETAADLAYGLCPLYLAGQLSLTGPELAGRGFDAKIEKSQHPRFGEMQVVSAKLADGEIGFGGAPETTCTVIVMGPNRAAALARLRRDMPLMGLDLQPDPANSGARGPAKVETFKARVEEKAVLYVQLIEADAGPTPMISAQLFAMEE